MSNKKSVGCSFLSFRVNSTSIVLVASCYLCYKISVRFASLLGQLQLEYAISMMVFTVHVWAEMEKGLAKRPLNLRVSPSRGFFLLPG
ncbi:MAG: hypothetical protein D3908_00835 [Candidatus Electrothrix sp. AUS4]|nr:hypothetical protein [Candidatus Electrothrix sp. AUS4]